MRRGRARSAGAAARMSCRREGNQRSIERQGPEVTTGPSFGRRGRCPGWPGPTLVRSVRRTQGPFAAAAGRRSRPWVCGCREPFGPRRPVKTRPGAASEGARRAGTPYKKPTAPTTIRQTTTAIPVRLDTTASPLSRPERWPRRFLQVAPPFPQPPAKTLKRPSGSVPGSHPSFRLHFLGIVK